MRGNLYIAFACKECRRWVGNNKRDAPLDSKILLIDFVRKSSCKCPICKKNYKLYNKRTSTDNCKYRLFTHPEDRSEFIQEINAKKANPGFVTYN